MSPGSGLLSVVALLGVAGCTTGELAPSLEAGDDVMLRALPASSTVLASVELGPLRADERLLEPVATAVASLAELGIDADQLDRLALGCGDSGCVTLAEGDHIDAPSVPEGGQAAPGGFDVQSSEGPVSVRRLSEQKLALGDVSAMYALAEASTTPGEATFDPSWIEARVPAGDVWMVAHTPDRLADQALRRLPNHDAMVAFGRLAGQSAGVASVAVAVDLSGDVARARAQFDSPGSARRGASAWRVWQSLHRGNPLSEARLVRSSAALEWTLALSELQP